MRRKALAFVILIVAVISFSGCASLNGDVPFRYQPSLVSISHKIDKKVGINLLVDKRPESDVAYTKSIKDISEKVTSKLIEDFEKSKIFSEVHFPAQASDDIIIDGTVDRFMWKMYATTISYIPVISLAIYFGVPCQEAYGIAEITLDVKDNKTGQSLGKLSESSKVETAYTLYNFKAGDAGAELSEAFRDVAKKLKQGLLTKIEK